MKFKYFLKEDQKLDPDKITLASDWIFLAEAWHKQEIENLKQSDELNDYIEACIKAGLPKIEKKVTCNGGNCAYKTCGENLCIFSGYCDYQCPRDSYTKSELPKGAK